MLSRPSHSEGDGMLTATSVWVAILNLASPMRLKPEIQGLVLHGRYIWGGGPGSTTPQKHLLLKIDAESINMLPI